MTTLHAVVPAGIDDLRRPSGGNHYDRRLFDELTASGWVVQEHPVAGPWPRPTPADRDELDAVMRTLPDDSLVLVDGLIASAAGGLADCSRRLRLVVLVHMPLSEWALDEDAARIEASVLAAASAVITTSAWSRTWVVEQLGVDPTRVRTAIPGVDEVVVASRLASADALLCVGPVTAAKGQDVLVAALGTLVEFDWTCTLVGATDLEAEFVGRVVADAAASGITDRLVFAGPLTRTALDDVRAGTGLVISVSRRESYGMAVAEGLAAGIPVVATDVGGQREAVGRTIDGDVPGALIPPGDPRELAVQLRRWLTDLAVRTQWRDAALQRRKDLPDWAATARTVADVLTALGEPDSGSTPHLKR